MVVGFSDITALHLALWRSARLATVHGPGAGPARPTEFPAAAKRAALRDAIWPNVPSMLTADPDAETGPVRGTGAGRRRYPARRQL